MSLLAKNTVRPFLLDLQWEQLSPADGIRLHLYFHPETMAHANFQLLEKTLVNLSTSSTQISPSTDNLVAYGMDIKLKTALPRRASLSDHVFFLQSLIDALFSAPTYALRTPNTEPSEIAPAKFRESLRTTTELNMLIAEYRQCAVDLKPTPFSHFERL